MPKNIFGKVAANHPGLNHFDLSYTNTQSMKMGILYPVQADMVIPGDYWKMKAFVHAELMPLVAPIMSDIEMYVHTFFVPFRILYGVDTEDGQPIWEKFITGGQSGDYDTPLTPWTPDFRKTGFSSLTIWDSIGNPMKLTTVGSVNTWTPIVPYGLDVMAAPKLAYNSIWNNFYRSEDFNEEVDLWSNEDLLNVNFKKDYFTSAAWAQQRGTAPALPVDVNFNFAPYSRLGAVYAESGDSFISPKVIIPKSELAFGFEGIANNPGELYGINIATSETAPSVKIYSDVMTGNIENSSVLNIHGTGANGSVVGALDSRTVRTPSGSSTLNEVNSSFNNAVKATTFSVSDLRLAFAIQRLQELSMTGGYRYTEYLHSHYGVSPTDARLDRPEYIGGFVTNVTVSPVVQTSATASQPTALGDKGANGRIDTVQKIGNYRVLEHGIIMTLVNIVPKPIYSQGVNRQWLYQDRFMFYIPELANLSEFGLYNCEVYTDGINPADIEPAEGQKFDNDIFGYQAAWNEMRCKNSVVAGAVREQFDYWTLARKFASRPQLNADFLKVDSSDFNRIFAVQDEDNFIVSFSNLIDAYRPIPAMGTPGLIDHVYGGR